MLTHLGHNIPRVHVNVVVSTKYCCGMKQKATFKHILYMKLKDTRHCVGVCLILDTSPSSVLEWADPNHAAALWTIRPKAAGQTG